MWRVATGKHQSAQVSFMLVGHTNFAPDRHFGLIKKSYRRTRVDTISSIQRVVETSSTCGANKAQLIHDSDGNVQVHFYDWTEFLKQYYKTIPSITKYHVFIVKQDQPFSIILKQHSRAEKESLNIGKQPVPEGTLPLEIHAKGLDLERQWYLYEKIRPFCSCTLAGDITCPKPSEPKPTVGDLAQEHMAAVHSPIMPGSTKRPRKSVTCSLCKHEGHTKRTCPLNK